MKLAPSYTKHISFCVLAGCAALSLSAQLAQNLRSTRAQTNRSAALETVAKHSLVNNCMTVSEPLLIGDVVQLEGNGKSPTSCVIDKNQRIGYVAYLNNELQVMYMYTRKELNSQVSVIKKGK
jgi:hypothetical protein